MTDFTRSLGCQGKGQSGSARASLEFQGESNGARGQRLSGMPVQVWGAKASLKCQGQSGVPTPIWGARGSVRCQGQSEMAGPM